MTALSIFVFLHRQVDGNCTLTFLRGMPDTGFVPTEVTFRDVSFDDLDRIGRNIGEFVAKQKERETNVTL